MGLPRFFAGAIPERGLVELVDTEAHHAVRSLRSTIGDDVLVFDGRGFEGFGTIREIAKRSVLIDILTRRFLPRDSDGLLHFGIAMPKGDRQRNVIERLVELGVDSLTPVESARSVAHVDSDASERLSRYELEACKQCQRNRRMEIRPSITYPEFLDTCTPESSWLVHPRTTGMTFNELLTSWTPTVQGDMIAPLRFIIGPEGGFTDEEVNSAIERSISTLSLGERILRVETAVAAVATVGLAIVERTKRPASTEDASEDRH